VKLRKFLLLLALLLILPLSGCGSGSTPEDQVRQFLEDAETAAEENKIRQLAEMIDNGYSDPAGRNKQDLLAYLSYQRMQRKSAHAFTTIDQIDIAEPGSAQVEMLAALTATPVTSVGMLPDLKADIYSFSLRLIKRDDRWYLTSAEWQPAMLNDLVQE
jgi:hypothetical protein